MKKLYLINQDFVKSSEVTTFYFTELNYMIFFKSLISIFWAYLYVFSTRTNLS